MKISSRVSIYVRNKTIRPSNYYRIIQYLKDIEGEVNVHSLMPDRLTTYSLSQHYGLKKLLIYLGCYITQYFNTFIALLQDLIQKPTVIYVQREIIPRWMPPLMGLIYKTILSRSKVVWDFDDDIFENREISIKEKKILEKYSDVICVTSLYLKTLLAPNIRDKAITIPTTDGEIFLEIDESVRQNRKKAYKEEIRLVWVATAANMPNLMAIMPLLDRAALKLRKETGKKLLLISVCSINIPYQTKYLQIKNVQWTRKKAIDGLKAAHIGIMPLLETKYALGKGGFKLIQYLAAGLPVLASDIGFNKDVVSDRVGFLISKSNEQEWEERIVNLSTDFDYWSKVSDGAFQRWRSLFSYNKNLKIICGLLDAN